MNRSRSSAALSLLTLASLSCGGADQTGGDGGGEKARRTNVLIVVVDTLRRDHLSAYGYERATSPNVAALAAEGVRFDSAYSQAPWTTPSIGSLLSSRYPTSLGIQGQRNALSPAVELLPETLTAAGYNTAGVVSHSFVGRTWNFDQGFAVFDESNVKGHAAVTSDGVTDVAASLLEKLASEDAPFFLFVHYFDPHVAYVDHAEHGFGGAQDYDGPVHTGMLFRDLKKIQRSVEPRDLEEVRRLYDSEIAYTDAQIGRLFERARELGVWDDSLVVFTADHGEEFLDHGKFGHAKTLYDELVRVPLVVKYPAGTGPERGTSVTDPVALVDVAPTVAEIAGVAPAAGSEGLSLLAERPPQRPVFSETGRVGNAKAVVEGSLKLVLHADGRRELYDLAADPGEKRSLTMERPADVERLAAALDSWTARVSAQILSGGEVELDEAERARIDNLGYGGDD